MACFSRFFRRSRFGIRAKVGQLVAPGVIWLCVTFASVLGLSRTWTREREEGALRGLIVAPIARSAIFAGKALGVFAFITAIEIVVIPAAALLLGFDLRVHARGLW